MVQKSKLLLVGSKPSEVEEVLKGRRDMVTVRDDLAGVVVPKGYKRVALNHPPGPSEFSPYRCVWILNRIYGGGRASFRDG